MKFTVKDVCSDVIGYHLRTTTGPCHIWVYICGQLAVDLLGGFHHCRGFVVLPPFPSRDLRAHHPRAKSPQDAERDLQS